MCAASLTRSKLRGDELKMATKEGSRIFVGGLSPEVTERDLERTFGRFGDILDCQVTSVSSTTVVCYFSKYATSGLPVPS
ncbi:hypothetical protein Bca52824_005775 [Brassica carinata]|uniref:RRM domain-containing protein n=1 Tax=Brassica carinata TaxID=52824 RepID=A0A8X7WSE3_BRACI|nr:hypothetical protein Bca52824_005775 [Brassica carinata]